MVTEILVFSDVLAAKLVSTRPVHARALSLQVVTVLEWRPLAHQKRQQTPQKSVALAHQHLAVVEIPRILHTANYFWSPGKVKRRFCLDLLLLLPPPRPHPSPKGRRQRRRRYAFCLPPCWTFRCPARARPLQLLSGSVLATQWRRLPGCCRHRCWHPAVALAASGMESVPRLLPPLQLSLQ